MPRIIYFCSIADKIKMLTNNKCDLPKVRLKFKTTVSDITNEQIQIPRLSKYDAAPSIFPERLKMKKQINHAFMRYRKLKKHNYIKQFLNHKKSVSLTECKKMDTISTRNKNTTFQKKLEIALECTFTKGFQEQNSEYLHRNKVYSLKSKSRQSKDALGVNNNDLSNLKPHTILLKPKKYNNGHSLKLHDSELNCQQNLLELEGFKCQYETQQQRRERTLKLLKKTKKQLKATRGSSSFLIQAWKQQKIYRGASYYLKNQYDPNQF